MRALLLAPLPSACATAPLALPARDLEERSLTVGGPGDVRVVDFWATWCAPCVDKLPLFVELHERLRAEGGRVVAVSIDEDLEVLRAFLAEHPVPFEVVWDPAATASAPAIRLDKVPTTIVLDRDGRVRGVFPAPDDLGEIERAAEALLAE